MLKLVNIFKGLMEYILRVHSRVLYIFFFVISIQTVYGQSQADIQLANHYYVNGEYDKAKVYYDKLYKRLPLDIYFERYIQCMMYEKDFKGVEKILKKKSQESVDPKYSVELAKFYEEIGEKSKADKLYRSFVTDLDLSSTYAATMLFQYLQKAEKYEIAFQVITKARKHIGTTHSKFHMQFASYYESTKQYKKMYQEYFEMLIEDAYMRSYVEMIIQRRVDFTNTDDQEYILVKNELLSIAQQNPDNTTYAELLIWFFIQSEEFSVALIHQQALDKRLNLKGERVFRLGQMCVENNDFTTARKAFMYVKNIGETLPFYFQAENALLNTWYKEITNSRSVATTEIVKVIQLYEETLTRIGKNHKSLPVLMELAQIEAFYNNNAKAGIELLSEALLFERLTDIQRAEVKMQLADIHVLHGDIWEAALLYMQVDKDFKFEPIGQEARFKNARIFYYNGEFNYAQSQLDVLKEGTSKLIANDAIQLSLLITDNFGLDSNYTAMAWFAQADLLIEQHQYDRAFELFDSIITEFPYHSLGDEILIKKAQAMQQQGEWDKAIEYLDELLKYYADDILADDAWFIKGTIYQYHIIDQQQAMECYKTILTKFPGSLFSTEARKRYRELRGDSTI